jgi:drug/metabolite transporter (DMT)-like permease
MSLNGSIPSSVSSLEHSDDINDSEAFVTERDKSNVLPVSSTYASLAFEAGRAIIAYAKDHWKVIMFGQFLSFLLACAGAAQATLHFECSLSAPAFTNGIFYAAITFHLIPLYLKGKVLRESNNTKRHLSGDVREITQDQHTWFLGVIPLRGPFWGFALVGFLDVQANYLTVLSYRYTTLSSVSLFDSLAIPSAMFLSRLLLAWRHTKIHFLGVFICMIGIIYNAFADCRLFEKTLLQNNCEK